MLLAGVTLPENLYWENEYGFKSVAQNIARSVSGKLVVEHIGLSYGRPIFLTGAWADKTLVDTLANLQAQAGVYVLILNNGAEHNVIFDFQAGGFKAELLSPELNPTASTLYEIELNLITVE